MIDSKTADEFFFLEGNTPACGRACVFEGKMELALANAEARMGGKLVAGAST
jgi:hypothetical protein